MILEAIATWARLSPAAEAVVAPDCRLGYSELWNRAQARARELEAGTIVPVSDEDGPAFIVDWLGALLAGARPLSLHAGTTGPEVESLLARDPDGHPLGATSPGAEASRPHHEALLPTSGSTAEPRVARLGLDAIAWNAGAHALSIGLSGPDQRILVVSAMAHAATLVAQVVAGLQLGATLVLGARPFAARTFLETVDRERVTATALTPTHVRWLVDGRADAVFAAADLSSLRIVTVGSAPADPEALRLLARRFPGARIFTTYGLTEAGPRVTTLAPEDFASHPDSVGRPVAGVAVRIAHPLDPGRELPPGSEGELQVRTPSRMRGYLGEPELAAEWLPTGDLATIDTAGFVTLRGRLKDIIVCGGAKISPREVEHALCQDRRVREAAVVSEPHAALGEVVKAFVVPAGPLDADEILAALATRLSAHKLPRRVVVVDALPYTATGKVDKRRLKAGP